MPEKKYLRSNLFELLSTFSKSEMRKFEEFLRSPYHNKSKKLIKAFQFIKKYYPDFKQDKLTLQNIHNFIDPRKKFHAPTMRNVLSDMYVHALRFVSVQNYLSDNQFSYADVLVEMNQRKLLSLFDNYIKKIKQVIDGTKRLSTDLLFERFKINIQRINKEFLSTHYRGEYNNINTILKLYDDIFDDLISHNISMLIPMGINLRIFNIQNDIDTNKTKISQYLKKNTLKHIKREIFLNRNVNQLLLLDLKAYETYNHFDNTSLYFDYKKYFLKYSHLISFGNRSEHLTLLSNYCVLKKGRDDKNAKRFSNELLTLYDLMLREGLYKYAAVKYLQPLEFLKILIYSLDIGNYDFAYKLVNEHIDKLSNKDRNSMLYIGLMHIHFYLKNFDEAEKFSKKIDSKFRYLKFEIHDIKLRILFEIKDYVSALDLIKTYRRTVENSSMYQIINKSRRVNFLDVIKILSIIKLDEKELTVNLLDEVKIKIENAAYKKWLSEKLGEIISKMKKVGAA